MLKRMLCWGIVLSICLTFLPLYAGDYDELQKLVAPDRGMEDHFGCSVSISGDYAIVGAYREDEDSTGNNYMSWAGSAYIFYWDGETWELQAKLLASDRSISDYFGKSVAISGDLAIVGAPYEDDDAAGENFASSAGSAYIFKREGTGWEQQAKLVASDRTYNDYFGRSVSISGNYAIVGVPEEDEDASGENRSSNAGSAYIFYWDGSSWTQQTKIVASDRDYGDYFGSSVSLSGDYAIIGAVYANTAYIFKRNGTDWEEQSLIRSSDRSLSDYFAYSVSISGDYAIVGAINEDEDVSGGNTLPNAGSAYIFKRDGASWEQQAKIVASDRDEDDAFGYSVSISGNHAIVAAFYESENVLGDNTLPYAGSAYIYKRDGISWVQQAKIVPFDRESSDYFGTSVSIYGDHAIVGAEFEDENASGSDSLYDAGSAYIFSITGNDVGISAYDIPRKFILENNRPNPFNPTTAIKYQLSADSQVELTIYDMKGRKVANLINEHKSAGYHSVTWDASGLSSGIYFYRLTAGEFVETKKMVLMK